MLDGTKAIRESRWADALKIFDKVAEAKGVHAAGALYWKAYAESKMGDSNKVLENCAALRSQYVGSTWIDDCGALEIELKAKKRRAGEAGTAAERRAEAAGAGGADAEGSHAGQGAD